MPQLRTGSRHHLAGPTRRGVLVGGPAAATGALLAACGTPSGGPGSGGEGAARSGAARAPVTISFSHWGTESGLGVMNREAARQFMQQYPHLTVELVFKPEDYLTHLRTMVAGGSAPDVFDISTPDFGPPVKDGWTRPVDDYVKRDQGRGFDWNDLWPKHRDSGKVGGKIHGVLGRVSPNVLYYNPDHFRNVNVKLPDQSWGFAEFLDAARRLTSPPAGGQSERYGFAINGTNHWIWRNGGDYIVPRDENREKWRSVLNTQATIDAVQMLQDIRYKHNVVGTADTLGSHPTRPYSVWYTEGQVSMMEDLVARVTDYRAMPKMTFDTFDVAHLPKLGGQRATNMDRVVRPIAAQSRYPEEGWQWIQFLLQKPAITAVSMPAVMSWVRSNEFLRPDLPPRNMKVFLEALEYARTTPEHPRWGELSTAISKHLNEAFNNRQTAKQACEQADRDATALLQQWGQLG
ncbi:MAG TPA: sugar ABC transporter substrate-binding protein [Chloroflexota bacterium]|nr:sugar ABC transporter substrate-binding protein [Chloroflexota bacterium]